MRQLSDVINMMLAVIPEGESSAKALRDLLANPHRLAFDIPEHEWAWGPAGGHVRDAVGWYTYPSPSLPLRFGHADRWRAAVLAIWRDTTIEALEEEGIVKVEPEPRKVFTWVDRVQAALGSAWTVYVSTHNDLGDDYIGHAQCGDIAPRPHIEIRHYDNGGTPTLRFVPVLHEATGFAEAGAAWHAFGVSSATVVKLNGMDIAF